MGMTLSPNEAQQVTQANQGPTLVPPTDKVHDEQWMAPPSANDKIGQDNIFQSADPDAPELQAIDEDLEPEKEKTCWEKSWVWIVCIISTFVILIIFIVVLVLVYGCFDDAVTSELNKQDGRITDGMSRVVITPRPDL